MNTINSVKGSRVADGLESLTPSRYHGLQNFNSGKYEYRIMNKEPQNDEGSTSTFDISCSIFCGSKIAFFTKFSVEVPMTAGG